jgi:hypothetical protein
MGLAGCARSRPPVLLLTPQTRFGLGDRYGPGIVAASARAMRYQLGMDAHVIVLRVTEDGIDQVRPGADHDPTEKPGLHAVSVPTTRRRDVTGLDPADFTSGPGSLSCVPVLDPNLNAKPDPTCVERVTASTAPQPLAVARNGELKVNEVGYWLLIVSDARTTPAELKVRLLGYEAREDDEPEAATLVAIVQELPGLLVGGRTTSWAAYYVGFIEVHTPER